MLAVIARVKEWQSEFAEVEQNGAKIVSDCEHFDLKPPSLVGLNDVRADIESYNKELDAIAQEDWVSFRQRLWVFEDFVAAWVEKLGHQMVQE
jgi:dynein heavy chain 2